MTEAPFTYFAQSTSEEKTGYVPSKEEVKRREALEIKRAQVQQRPLTQQEVFTLMHPSVRYDVLDEKVMKLPDGSIRRVKLVNEKWDIEDLINFDEEGRALGFKSATPEQANRLYCNIWTRDVKIPSLMDTFWNYVDGKIAEWFAKYDQRR